MDKTAYALSQDNKMPIVVFDMNKQGNLYEVCMGNPDVGTLVVEKK
jgi:uridylate kinase